MTGDQDPAGDKRFIVIGSDGRPETVTARNRKHAATLAFSSALFEKDAEVRVLDFEKGKLYRRGVVAMLI